MGFASSEGLMNFYISLLPANAIILMINKNGSQESEWTSTTGLDDIFECNFQLLEQIWLFLNSFVFAECGMRRTSRNLVKLIMI